MRSMKQLRQRISSVTGTRQMVATMKVVSLARLKKKHAKLLKAMPYLLEMNRMMRRLIRSVLMTQEQQSKSAFLPALLMGHKEAKKYMVVIVASDTGLNGGSIWSVLQKAQELINYLLQQKKQVQLVCFGTHGANFFKRFFPELTLYIFPRKKVDEGREYLSAIRLKKLAPCVPKQTS